MEGNTAIFPCSQYRFVEKKIEVVRTPAYSIPRPTQLKSSQVTQLNSLNSTHSTQLNSNKPSSQYATHGKLSCTAPPFASFSRARAHAHTYARSLMREQITMCSRDASTHRDINSACERDCLHVAHAAQQLLSLRAVSARAARFGLFEDHEVTICEAQRTHGDHKLLSSDACASA